MTRAAIYARVSSREQVEGYSIDAQLGACRKFAAEHGFEVVREYVELAESGSSRKRTHFTMMLRDAQQKTFDVFLVHKLNRFARNVRDALNVMHELAPHNVTFASVVENFDFTTATGRMIFTVLVALGEYFLEDLRGEIHKGKSERARQGLSNASFAPFGYRRAQSQAGGAFVPSANAPHVRAMFEAYAAGASYAAIASDANAKGLRVLGSRGERPFTPESVGEIIRNPFYAGWVRERGVSAQYARTGTRRRVARKEAVLHRGAHEPIITQDLFDACERERAKRNMNTGGRTPANADTYLLRGLLYCVQCGARLRGSARAALQSPRYMCPTPHAGSRHVTEVALMPDVEAFIASFRPREAIERMAITMCNDDERARANERERKSIAERRRRLLLQHRDGYIGDRELGVEMNRLDARLKELAVAPEAPTVVDQLGTMAELWQSATRAERAGILHAIVDRMSVDLDAKRVTQVTLKPEFRL